MPLMTVDTLVLAKQKDQLFALTFEIVHILPPHRLLATCPCIPKFLLLLFFYLINYSFYTSRFLEVVCRMANATNHIKIQGFRIKFKFNVSLHFPNIFILRKKEPRKQYGGLSTNTTKPARTLL